MAYGLSQATVCSGAAQPPLLARLEKLLTKPLSSFCQNRPHAMLCNANDLPNAMPQIKFTRLSCHGLCTPRRFLVFIGITGLLVPHLCLDFLLHLYPTQRRSREDISST